MQISIKIIKYHTDLQYSRRAQRAFTLVEVMFAAIIAATSCAGILYGYVLASREAEWTSCSLAAQSLAIQSIEQARAARWGALADDLQSSNFPTIVTNLDIPMKGTNQQLGTNITTISDISFTPPLRMISSCCSWRFFNGKVYSNTMVTYRSWGP